MGGRGARSRQAPGGGEAGRGRAVPGLPGWRRQSGAVTATGTRSAPAPLGRVTVQYGGHKGKVIPLYVGGLPLGADGNPPLAARWEA